MVFVFSLTMGGSECGLTKYVIKASDDGRCELRLIVFRCEQIVRLGPNELVSDLLLAPCRVARRQISVGWSGSNRRGVALISLDISSVLT